MAGVLPLVGIRSTVYSGKHMRGLWKSIVALHESSILAFTWQHHHCLRGTKHQEDLFFFPSSWISSPYHPGVLTSKASYSWVNEDNSQLSRAISIKLWNPLVSPCLLEVAVSVSPRLGLIGTWAYWVWLSVMVLTQEGGPQQQVRLNFRHDKCHS